MYVSNLNCPLFALHNVGSVDECSEVKHNTRTHTLFPSTKVNCGKVL